MVNITVANNPDKTVNFTNKDFAEHGIAELVSCDDEQFVVVFWAKDISGIKDSDLISELNQFNMNNNVTAIAFWFILFLLFFYFYKFSLILVFTLIFIFILSVSALNAHDNATNVIGVSMNKQVK